MNAKEKCPGPVYFGDQGIEVCTKCGGCICCDFEHIDHEDAERECLRGRDGRCLLKGSYKGHHVCKEEE